MKNIPKFETVWCIGLQTGIIGSRFVIEHNELIVYADVTSVPSARDSLHGMVNTWPHSCLNIILYSPS